MSSKWSSSSTKSKSKSTDTGYKPFRKEVDKLSNKSYKANKATIDPSGLRGKKHGKDLDHKTSVKSCYNSGMSAEACAAPSNLQIMDAHENRSQGCKEPGCRGK